jgi:predicted transcriptional regulator of viral defense system
MPTPSLRRLKTLMASLPFRVFTVGSWGGLVREHPEWGRSSSGLRAELEDAGVLTVVELRSESDYSPKKRYVLSKATTYEIAVSLQKRAFLCHASAAALHGLTEQVPQTFYVNVEQTKKQKSASGLSQSGIDRAFQGPQRMSKYVFIYGEHRIVQLSGKNSSRHGVVDIAVPGGGPLVPCTSVERTLIDLLVRPSYGGGVHEVLVAFRLAKGRVSISELVACLRALDYVYPYHQSLGFYLERAGYDERHVARIREMPREFDFYLAYGMTDPVLDETWRVYHPRTL